jgi:hypothetical protein
VNRMHDCERFEGPTVGNEVSDRDPLAELQVITTLYFPELKAEVDRYLERCRAWRSGAPRTTGIREFGSGRCRSRSGPVERRRSEFDDTHHGRRRVGSCVSKIRPGAN